MTGLSIKVLGDVEIRVDDEPLDVDTRKATALLIFLAVTGNSAARDHLCSLLWSELEPDRARAALRRTLSVLRKALDGRWLSADGDRVRLAGDLWLDLAQAELHASRAELEEALSFYRGEFMAGFSLRDSPDYEEWQLRQADLVRHRHAVLLKEATDAAAAGRDYPRAVERARARVELAPLDEDAHRQLMLTLVWAGDRAGALRQYRECVRILDEELGVPPLPETSELEERILCDDIPATPSEAGREDAGEPGSGPVVETGEMVGRQSEFVALRNLVEAPGGRVAAVVGPPGAGKSRLVDEVATWASAHSRVVVRAKAYEGEADLGLVVVGEALRAAIGSWEAPPELADSALLEASRLLPELAPGAEPPTATDPGGQGRFFDGVSSAFATLLGEGGVLVLDDLQWADPASLDLIAYLVRRPQRFSFCVILIWRKPPVDHPHPLQGVVSEQAAPGHGLVIDLPPLSTSEVEDLAHRVRPDIGDGASRQVARESAGNPLLALSYLRLIDPATGDLPEGPDIAEQLTEARLRGVGDLGRQILAAASIIGRSFDQGTVRATGGRTDEETAQALEELVGAGVLTETDDGLLDFAHDVVRQHARDTIPAVRRRLLHGRLADHLQSRISGGRSATAGRLAHHLAEAGRLEDAALYRALAGDHARSLFAHQEAMAHYETALALGHPDPTSIHTAIGDLHTLTGDYAAALDSYRTASARATGEELARVEHRLGEVNGRLGRWELAVHHFEAAVGGLSAPAERIQACVDWARVYQKMGEPEAARAVVAKAAGIAEEIPGSTPPILPIMQGQLEPDPETAEARVRHGLELAATTSDTAAEAAGLTTLALIARRRQDLTGAIERVNAALDLVKRIGDRHRQATLHDLAADLFHEAGEEEQALEQLTMAVQLFAEVGTGGLEPAVWKTAPW